MTMAIATNVLNDMLDQISAAIDAGSGAGVLRGYDGSQPAKGGTATTLLFELTFSDPSCAAASGGVLTANAITPDSSADATGTCTWGRIVDSNGTFVMDMPVADMGLNTASVVSGVQVSSTGFVINAGNT